MTLSKPVWAAMTFCIWLGSGQPKPLRAAHRGNECARTQRQVSTFCPASVGPQPASAQPVCTQCLDLHSRKAHYDANGVQIWQMPCV